MCWSIVMLSIIPAESKGGLDSGDCLCPSVRPESNGQLLMKLRQKHEVA